MFSHEQILQLKSQINYREFYRKFLTLQQRGSYLFASCCFHAHDNSPSLCIDEHTGLYHCFACNAGGDCLDFYQRITGKSFTEAVLDIAKMFDIKIEISEELRKEMEYKKGIFAINNAIANLYQKALVQNKDGQNYLISRNFTLDIIKQFKIGYIPKNQLHELCPNMLPYFKEAGLTLQNEDGYTHNFFSTNRISIPFFDEYGHIVGFSSRAINNDIKPKYLHSRASKIFKKDELLFAYNFAKDKIKETKSVILTEGQIDCIRAHQYDITNCVATCGLALSEKQVNLLKNDVKNYYFIVEDNAGEEAVDRLYDTISATSFWANIKIIRLYEGDTKCDLDEFLQTKGKGEFLDKLRHAPTYHEYKLIDSLKNINYRTIEEKKFYIYNVRKYIAKITNPIDKKQYIELLAEKLELPENDVRKVISRAEQTDTDIQVGEYDDRRTMSQKYIIASFFSQFGVQKVYDILKNKLHINNKLETKFRKIYEKIVDVILLYGANSDLINIIHTTEVMTSEELKCLDDCYFKHDEFENLDDEEELKVFLEDMLENLK